MCLARYSPRATTTNQMSRQGLAKNEQKCHFRARFGLFRAKNPTFYCFLGCIYSIVYVVFLAGSFGALLVGCLVVVVRGLYLARHLFALFHKIFQNIVHTWLRKARKLGWTGPSSGVVIDPGSQYLSFFLCQLITLMSRSGKYIISSTCTQLAVVLIHSHLKKVTKNWTKFGISRMKFGCRGIFYDTVIL